MKMLEISAKQARQQTEAYIDTASKSQIESVFIIIKKEIEKGSYEAFYYGSLKKQTIEYFKKLGYNVTDQTNQMDGGQYKFSW